MSPHLRGRTPATPTLDPSPPLKCTVHGDEVWIAVHARPRSKRSGVLGLRDQALEVSVAAPPVEGAANNELVRCLAAWLGVSRSAVRLVHGAGGRHKTLAVRGTTAADVLVRLDATLTST